MVWGLSTITGHPNFVLSHLDGCHQIGPVADDHCGLIVVGEHIHEQQCGEAGVGPLLFDLMHADVGGRRDDDAATTLAFQELPRWMVTCGAAASRARR